MALLRKQIQTLRCKADGDHQEFIPHLSLYRLMTREVVLDAVNKIERIPWYSKNETLEWIMRGGRKIFAILVLLKDEESAISRFMEHDHYQKSPLDERLPFSMETLDSIIPDIAEDFCEMQWEFVAPILYRNVVHRSLPDKTRLPFVYNKKIAEGGFGVVYEIELHLDHQTICLTPREEDRKIVRKEFEAKGLEDDDYSNELHNLSILNELRHPNIIELLASYTHRGKHNFLFPSARDGDLARLLRQEERPPYFQADEAFFIALARLSSAIEMMHYYTSKNLDIEMIGCHRDLKPGNILVDRDAFILADFGLSKFSEATESSKSKFNTGAGNYLAPECEDYEQGCEKQAISRPSDIWSFGCIIIEILTYMRKGADGVNEFKKKRAVKVGNFRIHTFHAGSHNPNPEVTTWLSELEAQGDESNRVIVQLVRSMLNMDPVERPDAKEVTSRLRFIAVDVHLRLVDDLYQALSKINDSFEAYVEWERFKSWRWTFASVADEGDCWNRTIDTQLDLVQILDHLINVREELRSIMTRCHDALSPLFVNLRLLNDRLLCILPRELQARTKAHLELVMISTEDSTLLERTQKALEGTSRYERISMLAGIKRMSILAKERLDGSRSSLRLDSASVQRLVSFGDHALGVVIEGNGTVERRVLVEWIQYGHWESHAIQQLFERVEALADLLHRSAEPSLLQVLHCSAFFHDPSKSAFGLAYDFPCPLSSQPGLVPRNLADIVKSTATFRGRPSLGDRFRLAHILAVSILEFHKVGWLHKSISPYSVVFFTAKDSRAIEWLKMPYITGFNHSRQDNPSAFTVGPDDDSRAKQYHHPRYSMSRLRYRPEFDYYSLGIVLLEIGLWKMVDELLPHDKKASLPMQMQDELVKKRVPLLGHYMGSAYQDAVHACLASIGSDIPPTDEGLTTKEITSLHLAFERLVIEPLSRCYA